MSEIGKVKLPGTNTWLVDKADYDALAARLADYERDFVASCSLHAHAGLEARLAEADARAGEMEARYDRLTYDYSKKCEVLAEAEALLREARPLVNSPLCSNFTADRIDAFLTPADQPKRDIPYAVWRQGWNAVAKEKAASDQGVTNMSELLCGKGKCRHVHYVQCVDALAARLAEAHQLLQDALIYGCDGQWAKRLDAHLAADQPTVSNK